MPTFFDKYPDQTLTVIAGDTLGRVGVFLNRILSIPDILNYAISTVPGDRPDSLLNTFTKNLT